MDEPDYKRIKRALAERIVSQVEGGLKRFEAIGLVELFKSYYLVIGTVLIEPTELDETVLVGINETLTGSCALVDLVELRPDGLNSIQQDRFYAAATLAVELWEMANATEAQTEPEKQRRPSKNTINVGGQWMRLVSKDDPFASEPSAPAAALPAVIPPAMAPVPAAPQPPTTGPAAKRKPVKEHRHNPMARRRHLTGALATIAVERTAVAPGEVVVTYRYNFSTTKKKLLIGALAILNILLFFVVAGLTMWGLGVALGTQIGTALGFCVSGTIGAVNYFLLWHPNLQAIEGYIRSKAQTERYELDEPDPDEQ